MLSPTVSDRTTSTWDRIEAIAADHARREVTRNTPKAVAHRAVFALASTFGELSKSERGEIVVLITQEVLSQHPIA